jgi:hypothetical protein
MPIQIFLHTLKKKAMFIINKYLVLCIMHKSTKGEAYGEGRRDLLMLKQKF